MICRMLRGASPGEPTARRAVRAIFSFHLKVGARVALLALVPVLGTTVGALFFLGPDDVKALTEVLFGRRAGFPASCF
jgi:hypothetical protein